MSSALLGLRITFSGLLCVGVVVLVGLAALNSEANLLFLLFGISFGALLCSAAAPVFMVRKLEVERVVPGAVIGGRPFTLAYLVRSRRRWLRSWSLVIGEIPAGRRPVRFPLAFMEALRPGTETRVELTAICPRRGRLPLRGVRLMSRFPFGLFACTLDLSMPGELIMYPPVGRFRRDPWRDRRFSESPSQRNSVRQSGAHEEFYGVREYRPGDNLRWIHWRRSAHAGHLVVRESTPAQTQQLTVIVDPWPQPRELEAGATGNGSARAAPVRAPARPVRNGSPDVAEPARPLVPASAAWLRTLSRWSAWLTRRSKGEPWSPEAVEQVISLAATAICEALERGHRVGLIARGAIPVVIAPSGGRSHRQRLLHELAVLNPGAEEGLDQLISRIRWSSGWHGRCLLCATHYNRTHGDVVRFLASRTESALAITRDSDAFEALFELPADGLAETPEESGLDQPALPTPGRAAKAAAEASRPREVGAGRDA